MNNTTWRKELSAAFAEFGDDWENIESNTMTDEEMDQLFYYGYGGVEGVSFTVWTKMRVYFPICYDGAELVGSVSRNPDGKATEQQGGG